MKKIIVGILALAVASIVFAGTLKYETVVRKTKNFVKSVEMKTGDRVVIVINPTKVTGGTIITDKTIPASMDSTTRIIVNFKLKDK